LHHAVQLAEYLRDQNIMPKQVQDFYPTPATLSTCMFYTGYDPRTMEPVYVPIKNRDKARQRALIQYKKPQNKKLVVEALKEAGREDLIGSDKKALVYEATRDFKNPKNKQHKKNKRSGKRKSFKK
ncbi:MAG TPA: YgiQ family radical SAM protein, partial [Eubacteriaceae bacterium]|nr:YgiQ family radical SAM protein [Eubacteriaceae bacterium]